MPCISNRAYLEPTRARATCKLRPKTVTLNCGTRENAGRASLPLPLLELDDFAEELLLFAEEPDFALEDDFAELDDFAEELLDTLEEDFAELEDFAEELDAISEELDDSSEELEFWVLSTSHLA